MNPFVYWTSIFYHWYYEKPKSRDIAYESAIMMAIFCIFVNICSVIVIFNLWDNFSLGAENWTKTENYIKYGGGFIASCIILAFLAPKKKVSTINYETLSRFDDRTIAVSYWI
jgi:hypothetical protein